MRLKLVLIASLSAAIAGSGVSIAISLGALGSLARLFIPDLAANRWLVIMAFAPPAGAVILGSIFVYRHTARRRKLQAVLTAILTVVLCGCLLVAALLIIK